MQSPILSKIIGHRGACAYAPENTLASFKQALSLGCNYLEFDVMLSADGELFVFHDDTLERTTNGQGQLGLVSAEYLQSLDAGCWFSERYRGEKIPTLRSVLEWLALSNCQANIEIKPYPGTTEQTTRAVLLQLQQHWPQNKALPLISSFDFSALVLCRKLDPILPLGLLLHKWDKQWLAQAQQLACYSIHLNKRIITQARIRDIKAHGYHILAYTVNQKYLANKLFTWGVDAVFSDYPDLLGQTQA